MADPKDLGDEEVVRLLVDVPKADADFLEQYAQYRNALAVVRKKRMKRRWTRKSQVEAIISEAADDLRQQLAGMLDAVGPMPTLDSTPEKNRAAMEKYAAKVLRWTGEESEHDSK